MHSRILNINNDSLLFLYTLCSVISWIQIKKKDINTIHANISQSNILDDLLHKFVNILSIDNDDYFSFPLSLQKELGTIMINKNEDNNNEYSIMSYERFIYLINHDHFRFDEKINLSNENILGSDNEVVAFHRDQDDPNSHSNVMSKAKLFTFDTREFIDNEISDQFLSYDKIKNKKINKKYSTLGSYKLQIWGQVIGSEKIKYYNKNKEYSLLNYFNYSWNNNIPTLMDQMEHIWRDTCKLQLLFNKININETTENIEDIENTEDIENIEDIENSENSENIFTIKYSEDIENSECIKNSENSEDSEKFSLLNYFNFNKINVNKTIEEVEYTEEVENTEEVEDIEEVEDTDDTEEFEEIENIEYYDKNKYIDEIEENICTTQFFEQDIMNLLYETSKYYYYYKTCTFNIKKTKYINKISILWKTLIRYTSKSLRITHKELFGFQLPPLPNIDNENELKYNIEIEYNKYSSLWFDFFYKKIEESDILFRETILPSYINNYNDSSKESVKNYQYKKTKVTIVFKDIIYEWIYRNKYKTFDSIDNICKDIIQETKKILQNDFKKRNKFFN